ncbi:MAG: LptF/LptG family permease [Gemmatimonadales bacterium]|nr:LptF/LptG family permease [Gemmatimonadales bacterium]
MKLMGTLDRYVLRQWIGTFLLAVLGIPAVATLIHLAERFGPVSKKGIAVDDFLLGEALYFPGQVTLLFPAAVLFATVFTLNAMGRYSELTAVKAGGVSFYRLILPMLLMATLAVPANFGMQEIAAPSIARQRELHGERRSGSDALPRYQFAYQNESGWTYAIRELQQWRGYAASILIESPSGATAPTWTISADSALYDTTRRQWNLLNGATHLIVQPEPEPADSGAAADSMRPAHAALVMRDSATVTTVRFAAMRAKVFTEPPEILNDEGKKADEMSIGELREHLARLERSGTRPGQLMVDLPLKYAVPMACLIIALFGAPLAVTSPRAEAALGLAMALGTTLIYLTGTQIMKALGGKEIVTPEVAAWSMNALFLVLAIGLMSRVRS